MGDENLLLVVLNKIYTHTVVDTKDKAATGNGTTLGANYSGLLFAKLSGYTVGAVAFPVLSIWNTLGEMKANMFTTRASLHWRFASQSQESVWTDTVLKVFVVGYIHKC